MHFGLAAGIVKGHRRIARRPRRRPGVECPGAHRGCRLVPPSTKEAKMTRRTLTAALTALGLVGGVAALGQRPVVPAVPPAEALPPVPEVIPADPVPALPSIPPAGGT